MASAPRSRPVRHDDGVGWVEGDVHRRAFRRRRPGAVVGDLHEDLAAALRERFERVDQAELDAALDADREESIRAAEAFLPYAAALFAEAEW